jgi:hypothetical protein
MDPTVNLENGLKFTILAPEMEIAPTIDLMCLNSEPRYRPRQLEMEIWLLLRLTWGWKPCIPTRSRLEALWFRSREAFTP